MSEDEIEKSIKGHGAGVIIIIADACRSLISGTKGASLDTAGVVLPTHSAAGVYRLYSAGKGQVSSDSLEPVSRPEGSASYKPHEEKGKSKEKEKKNSLFTRVLVPQVQVTGQPFGVMAARVKSKVRDQARKRGMDQIPDFQEDLENTDYFFVSSEGDAGLVALCETAETKLGNLRSGIASGALGRETIDEMTDELSRCSQDIRDKLHSLRRIVAQGTGSFATQGEQRIDASKLTDPQQICDVKGSSPLDSDRPQGLAGVDIQQLALAAISGKQNQKESELEIKSIVDACEQAEQKRPRVARFKFNAATGNYALALMTTGVERTISLRKASAYIQKAVDLGYAAAYNSLAVMIQNGEFYKEGADAPEPADRDKAAELLKRGADRNHVVAQYNLGMAYLRGDLGLGNTSKLDNTGQKLAEQNRDATAFKYLSAAAERSYIPAMIETAKLLHNGRGVVAGNPKRAIELLEVAAYSGKWEAMYWLGRIYHVGLVRDDQKAIIWYARAAEAGDVRSQYWLADMLSNGEGVPAPQPEAAGRYFRLAAYGGSPEAQADLGDLLRDRKVPFRPMADRKQDSGALEIRTLYRAAFASGNPRAGLQLAKLYRTGFPAGEGSEAIPKDPERAQDLLYKTIERVKQAEPDSVEADPKVAAWAEFELISIYDKGEAKRRDGSSLLTDDQIHQLRDEFGDGSKQGFVRAGAIGPIACGDQNLTNKWLMVWDWNRDDPPTEPQLRWLERRYSCAEKEIAKAKESNERWKRESTPEDTGFTKEFRDRIARQYKVAREDAQKNVATAKSFYDRMAELVSKPSEGGGRRRHRR